MSEEKNKGGRPKGTGYSAFQRPVGTKRRRVGRPRKSKNNNPSRVEFVHQGDTFLLVSCRIKKENKNWLLAQCAAHHGSLGSVLDDIIECLRTGREVQVNTHVPNFVIKARKAEMKRKKRLEELGKQKQQNEWKSQENNDDGSEPLEF